MSPFLSWPLSYHTSYPTSQTSNSWSQYLLACLFLFYQSWCFGVPLPTPKFYIYISLLLPEIFVTPLWTLSQPRSSVFLQHLPKIPNLEFMLPFPSSIYPHGAGSIMVYNAWESFRLMHLYASKVFILSLSSSRHKVYILSLARLLCHSAPQRSWTSHQIIQPCKEQDGYAMVQNIQSGCRQKLSNGRLGMQIKVCLCLKPRKNFCLYIIVDADIRIKLWFLEHLPFENAKEFCVYFFSHLHNLNLNNS